MDDPDWCPEKENCFKICLHVCLFIWKNYNDKLKKWFTLVELPGEIGCEAVGVVEGLVPGGGSPLEETLSYADTMYGKLVKCIIQRIHPVGSGANENLRQSISLFGGWRNGRMV